MRPSLSSAMYYQHPQQQGSQPFPNASRPSQHQPPANQLPNPSNMQGMGFRFPRPTQLPDELESALAIRGARDMDHRQIDHLNQPNQGSGSVIGQQGGCGPNPISLTADNQPGHQQGVDWSSYQPPTKLFANPPPNPSPQGTQQQPQTLQSHGGGSGGDGHGLYTPESAGSILASFGLSNEDLEVLSHYPDDQLTPDTLPFILRDIQIKKSGKQKTVATTSTPTFSRNIHDMSGLPSGPSCSPEVPSLLTVTQTAGKVIDYGHASRGNDENTTRETFKREPLSSERTVKMYPATTSSTAQKVVKTESREVRDSQKEPNKHGDRDYRRTSSEKRKRSRSPEKKFPSSPKSRNLDRDYRHDGSTPRASSESRNKASSRQCLSASSGSRPHGSRKLPTPTMISDFAAVPPKVYPHTCSLCHIQCDEEKDWVDHINTVNHTSACRDLRNKYPDWKPNLPSQSGRYGSRALWDPKDGSPFHSASQSLSRTPTPPRSKYQVDTHLHRPHGRPYSPHRHPRPLPYTGGLSGRGVKRPHEDSSRGSASQASPKSIKGTMKPGTKTTKMSVKPLPAKKKKKVLTPASQDTSRADRLVYLTGIPTDASEQEVTDLVGSFGKINNVILMPCSEEESEKDQGQKASVCMMTAEDAQTLASSTNLCIRDQEITASVAKKCRVLITGLPKSGWSETDVIQLVQPFGTPSDIILAADIGKALVSLPDVDLAQEMVKVHSFKPATVNGSEVKIGLVKQHVGLSMPVALYNLLMGLAAPLESSAPVAWNTLLVIRNVPNTPSGASEVLKLVRRFGTVIKTLVLNSMVICEMATSAMALSVYKRFQTFPCIIHNNPLFFSRKPDPRANLQSKTIAACCGSPEMKSANGEDSQTAVVADDERTAQEENSELPLEGKAEDGDEKAFEETAGDESFREKESNLKKDEHANSDSSAEPATKADADPVTEMREAPAVEPDTAEVNKAVRASDDDGETKPTDDDDKPASQEAAMPTLPKMTQAMVNALLVECRTRTANQPNTAAPPTGEQEEVQVATEQGDKSAEKTKDVAKNSTEEEGVKKQERERKEREARKEKEMRERERRERERKAFEKERARREKERAEKARRERERREGEKREWEKREKERRERKRTYGEGHSGSRSYHRSEGYRHSSWRDDWVSTEAGSTKVKEELDDFPFNMSDFVTVDEVGDVTDLPHAPSPTVPMETAEEGSGAPTTGQEDSPEDTPTDASAPQAKSDEQLSEPECERVSAAENSNGLVLPDAAPCLDHDAAACTPPASPDDSSPSGTLGTACQSEAPRPGIKPEPDTTITAAPDSTPDVKPPSIPAPAASPHSSSNSPSAGVVTAESEGELRSCPFTRANSQEVSDMSQKQQEEGQMQEQESEDKTDAAVDAGKLENTEHYNTKEKSVKTELPVDTSTKTDQPLPPYDPHKPVGLEYLVPKTGFFCKVCSRFFSGAKVAEISHCKTLKHYENLQTFLQTSDPSSVPVRMDSN
ncbi:uncharacterized protein FYW49_008509 [Xenentodon cancila]